MERIDALRLRLGASHRDQEVTFPLPQAWQVALHPPAGATPLDAAGIAQALASPIGCTTIRERARSAQTAAILVDDFRRPTPAETLCLAVIEELNQAGIQKDAIRIFLGNGAHRTMTDEECRQRLGRAFDQVAEVISHDAFNPDVSYLGVTAAHTPVLINRKAAEADFSISMSTVYPHVLTGWGGGAKMVLPGIAHVSTSHYHHTTQAAGTWGGDPGLSPARRDLEEAAAMFGLDMSICCVIGEGKQLLGLTVGDPTQAHRQAVSLARKAYATDMGDTPPDLVIANSYPMDGDPTQLGKTEIPASQMGVPILIIMDYADPCPWHGVYHGPWSEFASKPQPSLPEHTPELLANAAVFMYCPQAADGYVPDIQSWYCDHDWDRLMAAMVQRFPKASVAVLPIAPLQIPRRPANA
jgi:lactate racemase